MAQLVDSPSEVPVWCNSTDVGPNHAAAKCGRKTLPAATSVAEIRALKFFCHEVIGLGLEQVRYLILF